MTMKNQLEKPLSTLTVEEYLNLNRQVISEYANRVLSKEEEFQEVINSNDLIYANEVLEITGYKMPTLYSKVSRSEIPVVSRRTPLTFSRKKINQWISNGRPKSGNK